VATCQQPIGEVAHQPLASSSDLRPEARTEQRDLHRPLGYGRREQMPQNQSFIGGRCGGR
jgi:hypothetical protein